MDAAFTLHILNKQYHLLREKQLRDPSLLNETSIGIHVPYLSQQQRVRSCTVFVPSTSERRIIVLSSPHDWNRNMHEGIALRSNRSSDQSESCVIAHCLWNNA